MTTRIVRVGNSLMVEIPEKLAENAGLDEGQAVEWVADERHSLAIVKKTVTDGLLEIEHGIAGENAREQHTLEEKRRAELGDLNAQRFLSMISKDKVEAAKWLRRAAEQGDRPSMYDLGRLFVNGDGIEKDIAKGYFWLFLSASAYSLKSTKVERARMNEEYRALQHIATSLTEQERERIEDSCREWLNAHKLTKCFNPKL
jgi:antitoxin component of MazEF toxin-antitoxin module